MNVLALCAGVGGLDLGLNLAEPSSRCVCYVEGEAYAASVLVSRMEDEALGEAPIWSDVRTFDARPWRGVVDCVTGGYPCQPFSVAGRKLGDADPRHLWPHVARVVDECRPEWCFFENVANHLRLGFRVVADDLRRLGYRVAAGLFTAAEVGAPHKRERLFVLAHPRSFRRQQIPRGAFGDEAAHGGEGRFPLKSDGDNEPQRLLQDVGATDGEGPQGRGVCGGERINERAAWRPSSPFPPPPGDDECWGRVLATDADLAPAVESALCRVVDGLAPRVDRLRACGNGVVPLVAAYAWRTLKADLMRTV